MTAIIDRITSTPPGRRAFQAVRPLVHLMRHVVNPSIPTDHMISRVSYRDRQFSILHRRTCADLSVVHQCFIQEQYDLPGGAHGALIKRLHQQIIDSGRQPLIVDCGANIGASSLWFLARYPQAHVIAIEPAPDNFGLLQRNCAGFDVDLKEAGVAATDCRAYLSNPGGEGWSYQTTESKIGPEITMLSLATLLADKPSGKYEPFILKIDIEGAEKTLFAGDSSLLNRFPLIIMEPHDWLLPGQRSSVEFFRFHSAAQREFCMKGENIASIGFDSNLLDFSEVKLSQ